jgi:ribosomal protein L40E
VSIKTKSLEFSSHSPLRIFSKIYKEQEIHMNPRIIASFLTEDANVNKRKLQDLVVEEKELLTKYGKLLLRAKRMKVKVPKLRHPITHDSLLEDTKRLHRGLKKIAKKRKRRGKVVKESLPGKSANWSREDRKKSAAEDGEPWDQFAGIMNPWICKRCGSKNGIDSEKCSGCGIGNQSKSFKRGHSRDPVDRNIRMDSDPVGDSASRQS